MAYLHALDNPGNMFRLLVILAIILSSFIFSIVCVWFYRKSIKRLEHTKRIWDDALLRAMYKPLQYLIWLWGLTLIGQLLIPSVIPQPYSKWIITLRETGTIMIIAWFCYRLTYRLEMNYYRSLDRYQDVLDQTTASALTKVTKFTIFSFVILLLIKYFFNVSLTGLWALGGAGSIIIGFAAKDMLANFFGGFMFLFDKPFQIGDLIRLNLIQHSGSQLDGWVQSIGWRFTKIKTRDMMPLYIPNSLFATAGIENLSHRSLRLIDESFGVEYQHMDKIDQITDELNLMLHQHKEVDQNHYCYAYVNKLDNCWININIYCYCKETKRVPYYKTKQDILLKVVKIFAKHEVYNANPARTLEIPDDISVVIKSNDEGA